MSMGKRQKQYPKGALVRLTNDEHMRLTELGKRADLSFSRFLVESGLTGQAPTNEDRIQRERAILQLARVGNNLNQIARQLERSTGSTQLQGHRSDARRSPSRARKDRGTVARG